jgi:hypothetical protein
MRRRYDMDVNSFPTTDGRKLPMLILFKQQPVLFRSIKMSKNLQQTTPIPA